MNHEKEELEKMYHEKLKKYVIECFLKQQGARNTKYQRSKRARNSKPQRSQ